MVLQNNWDGGYAGPCINGVFQILESKYIAPKKFYIWNLLTEEMLYHGKNKNETMFFDSPKDAEDFINGKRITPKKAKR